MGVVVEAYAIVDPSEVMKSHLASINWGKDGTRIDARTVMIKTQDAFLAVTAMMRSRWLWKFALFAKTDVVAICRRLPFRWNTARICTDGADVVEVDQKDQSVETQQLPKWSTAEKAANLR